MARFWAGLAMIFLAHSAAKAAQILPDDLDMLPPADVVILGEVHDNPTHNSHQARAVAALRPAALVFEMLSPEQAGLAMGLPRGDAQALGQALQWQDSGWPDFAMYHPIFTAAPDAALYGAALPRDRVRVPRRPARRGGACSCRVHCVMHVRAHRHSPRLNLSRLGAAAARPRAGLRVGAHALWRTEAGPGSCCSTNQAPQGVPSPPQLLRHARQVLP